MLPNSFSFKFKKVNSMLCYAWFANQHKTQGVYGMNDNLSHTSWKCKYHIVFAPKYRRKSIYGTLKSDIGKILRQLCELKKVEIHEAEACPDHIYMLVSIPPNISVSHPIVFISTGLLSSRCFLMSTKSLTPAMK